jgi:ABC-type amino acid transport substrate-binding protein
MKKFISFTFVALVLVLASCSKSCGRAQNSKNTVLRIGTNANFPPFESIDSTGKLVGLDMDVGRALAKKMGLEAEFKEFDFDALILALKQGQIDIAMSALSITRSRQKEINMVPYQGQPLTEMALLFWESAPLEIKNIADIKRLSDESGLKVSVQAGHYLEGFLKDEAVNLKPLAGPPEQILDIKYKKSWAAVLDIINAKKFAAEHPQLKLVIVSLPEEKWDLGYGIGIAKNNSELTQKIIKAVEELRSDGIITAIEKIWIEGEH